MKYKFFLSYTYNVYKGTETIEEGEIVLTVESNTKALLDKLNASKGNQER